MGEVRGDRSVKSIILYSPIHRIDGPACYICTRKAVKRMIENKNVGELLKACRLRAKKTQEEMAKHLHVDRSMISRWENDEIPAPYSVVRQWCAYTHGMDLMTMDLAGGTEGWKKLQKLEQTMRTMQEAMATISFQRKSSEGKVNNDERFRRPGLGGIFSRIRS